MTNATEERNVIQHRSLTESIRHISFVHGPDVGGIVFLLIAAVVELACGHSIGWDNPISIVAYHAALLFVVIAICRVWAIVRFEQRYNRYPQAGREAARHARTVQLRNAALEHGEELAMTYAERVVELESEGLDTSDAQGVADAEHMQGRVFDFDPAAPLDLVNVFHRQRERN